jgi:ribosomal-protein-serine acetyltransferase
MGAQPFDLGLITSAGDALVGHGRNALVRSFLDTPAASRLLFIDPDLGFEPAAVHRLFAFDEDVVAGMGHALGEPSVAVAPSIPGVAAVTGRSAAPALAAVACAGSEAEERGGFVTARYAGAGFMMVKRSAIERLIAALPAAGEIAVTGSAAASGAGTVRSEVFACMREPETGAWLSEGFAFCRRFREIGGKVWLDTQSPFHRDGPASLAEGAGEQTSGVSPVLPTRSELRAHPMQTDRLVLAPVELADTADLWTAIDGSRAELEAWLPTAPFNTDAEASRRHAIASALEWDQGRAFRFTIRDRKTHELYGVVGVESFAQLQRSIDLGYWLRSDVTGRGLATEAAREVIAWAFTRLGVHRVRVATATNNDASLGVIRRLGFRFEGVAREVERCRGRLLDHAVFALLATDRPRMVAAASAATPDQLGEHR